MYRENDPLEPPKPKIYFDFFRPFKLILSLPIHLAKLMYYWPPAYSDNMSGFTAIILLDLLVMVIYMIISSLFFGGLDQIKWAVVSILGSDVFIAALGFMLGFEDDDDDENYDLVVEKFK